MLREPYRRLVDRRRIGSRSRPSHRLMISVDGLELRGLLSRAVPVDAPPLDFAELLTPNAHLLIPDLPDRVSKEIEAIANRWRSSAGELQFPPDTTDAITIVESPRQGVPIALPQSNHFVVADRIEDRSESKLYQLPISDRTRQFDISVFVSDTGRVPESDMKVAVLDAMGRRLIEVAVFPGRGAKIAMFAPRPPQDPGLFLEISAKSLPVSSTPLDYSIRFDQVERTEISPRDPVASTTTPTFASPPHTSFDDSSNSQSTAYQPAWGKTDLPTFNGSTNREVTDETQIFIPTSDPTGARGFPVQAASPVSGLLDLGLEQTQDASKASTGPDGEPIVERLLLRSSDGEGHEGALPEFAMDELASARASGRWPLEGEFGLTCWDEAIARIQGATGSSLVGATIWVDQIADQPALMLAFHNPPPIVKGEQEPCLDDPPSVNVDLLTRDDSDAIRPPTVRAALLATAALAAGLWLPDLRGDTPSLHHEKASFSKLLIAFRNHIANLFSRARKLWPIPW
jgi:hypothetical protein